MNAFPVGGPEDWTCESHQKISGRAVLLDYVSADLRKEADIQVPPPVRVRLPPREPGGNRRSESPDQMQESNRSFVLSSIGEHNTISTFCIRSYTIAISCPSPAVTLHPHSPDKPSSWVLGT